MIYLHIVTITYFLCLVRKKDWKDDGSDLMEDAELYFKEAKSTGSWGKKTSNVDTMAMYAFQATDDSTDETDWKSAYENELKKAATASLRRDSSIYSPTQTILWE